MAHDLFAETNPAFGTFALLVFCRSYKRARRLAPNVALAYLALPIAFSNDLDRTFVETAATTGLLSWLNRYPELKVDLGPRLTSSRDMVTDSIRFGLSSRALQLLEDGTLDPNSSAPTERPLERLPEDAKQVMSRVRRLGTWMGAAGTPGSVFSAFGVTP